LGPNVDVDLNEGEVEENYEEIQPCEIIYLTHPTIQERILGLRLPSC
jgi:hypothetical protein